MRFTWIIIWTTLINTTYGQQAWLVSNTKQVAGTNVEIEFQLKEEYHDLSTKLIIFHNFGVISLSATASNCFATFTLPGSISDHTGDLSLQLKSEGSLLAKAKLYIAPNTYVKPHVESYHGPKQILTGGVDYTAIVSTTLDSMDNPWPQGTPMDFSYIFKGTVSNAQVPSARLYAHQQFYSGYTAGNATLTTSSNEATHQEFDLALQPNFPQIFRINVNRDHAFADGKQITNIYTSRITDRYGNTISDGTFVHFSIYSASKIIAQAYGETIRGVAAINLPAPIDPMAWKIEAHVGNYTTGIPTSIRYKKSIQPFTAKMIDGNQLETGTIRGFNKQLVADHTPVTVTIMKDDTIEKIVDAFTKNGVARFNIKILNLMPCQYTVKLSCGGEQVEITANVL